MKYFLTFFLFPVILIAGYGCSSSGDLSVKDTSKVTEESNDNSKTFSFKKYGDNYTVTFEDDTINTVYKNGSKVPDSSVAGYEDLVYENIPGGNMPLHHPFINLPNLKLHLKDFDSQNDSGYTLKFDSSNFPFNMKEFKDRMKDFRIKIDTLNNHDITVNIDRKALAEGMGKLMTNMNGLNMEMNKLNKELNSEVIEKMTEELKDLPKNLEFNSPELISKITEAQSKMNDAGTSIKDLEKELKNLDVFIDHVKKELVEDNLLKNGNDLQSIKLSNDEMIVNGSKAPKEKVQKYKLLYKRIMGKELKGSFEINN